LLSEWLADVRCSSGVRLVVAPNLPEEAICAIGSNAIPTLLKWISYEGSSQSFGQIPPGTRWHKLSTGELAETAPSAFGFLGAAARPAIPQLTRLVRTSSEHWRAERCAAALAAIGPEAIPTLCSLATNGPPWVRYAGAAALERFCRKPEGLQTLPALIKCLEDTNTYYSAAGEAQLSLIVLLETYPAATLPALTNALQSPSPEARRLAIGCLQVETESTNFPPTALPSIRAAMGDSDPQVRSSATNILRQIGEPEAPGANQHLQPTPR